MTSVILPRTTQHLRIERFDPHNAEHVEAFVMLTKHGRQHPSIRFVLEHPYLDVRSMMYDKIGQAYVARFMQQADNHQPLAVIDPPCQFFPASA